MIVDTGIPLPAWPLRRGICCRSHGGRESRKIKQTLHVVVHDFTVWSVTYRELGERGHTALLVVHKVTSPVLASGRIAKISAGELTQIL